MADKKTRLLLWKATETRKHDIIPKVLAKGIPIDEPLTDAGMVGLHLACAQGDLDSARIFVENGADVNSSDKVGRTALHFASANGESPDLIDFLISNGADPNAQSSGGDTPLIKAILFDNAEVVRSLIEGGADKTISNASGRDAISFAEASKNEDIIALLD
ncbi:unnamed protein product [Moneuplotes crassus]|uniref:Ankyrin repeat domain-containing protein n=2 Tax=Euplotes crassus TaxID=5936 RepID=A0AAD1XWP1_EUPCR|nr:unnamed protein product [Moneuplotes crassus]